MKIHFADEGGEDEIPEAGDETDPFGGEEGYMEVEDEIADDT